LNPFSQTQGVAIELSNLCDWASIHKYCPLSVQREVRILPTVLILDILFELRHWDYRGYVAFHRYNEPLTDPRLYYLLLLRQLIVPHAWSYLCTNARYLTRKRLYELAAFGVTRLHASVYESREAAPQILEWAEGLPMDITLAGLKGMPHQKDLLTIYDAPKDERFDKPCGAPLWEVVVTSGGQVGLCCKDWRNHHTSGSLEENSLAEILLSHDVQEAYRRLSAGDRFLDLCSRCKSARGVNDKAGPAI
jgi:hypothetical protein